MITISKSQLRQVEYLIHQSIQGNHVLFDIGSLKDALHADAEAQHGLPAESIERHIESLISLPSLAQKKAYLERMDQDEFKGLIRCYLAIIENSLLERSEVRH